MALFNKILIRRDCTLEKRFLIKVGCSAMECRGVEWNLNLIKFFLERIKRTAWTLRNKDVKHTTDVRHR